MERTAVTSTNLASVGYDESSETLEVEFKHGGIYQYFNVPSVLHEGLMQATSSHGKFFMANIRDHFPHERV